MKKVKAFTLVELLVTISILSVLATVSIFGYSSFVKKARLSNDIALVEQWNTYIQGYLVEENIESVYQLKDFLKPITGEKFVPETEGCHFYWNKAVNRIYLIDDSEAYVYSAIFPTNNLDTLLKSNLYDLNLKYFTITSEIVGVEPSENVVETDSDSITIKLLGTSLPSDICTHGAACKDYNSSTGELTLTSLYEDVHFYIPGYYDENDNLLEKLSFSTATKSADVVKLLTDFNAKSSVKATSIILPDKVETITRDTSKLNEYAGKKIDEVGFAKIGDVDWDKEIENYLNTQIVDLRKVIIPNTVTKLDGFAFSATNIVNIDLPGSLTQIGGDAFGCCKSLESIYIPDNVRDNFGSKVGFSYLFMGFIPLTYNYDTQHVFYCCENLKTARLPFGMETIGSNFFHNCFELETIEFPRTITNYEEYSFQGCKKLTSISIPSSMTSIKDGTFDNCQSLTSIVIPSKVTSIGKWAFQSCYSLSSVEMPNSVGQIYDSAFAGCKSLKSITLSSKLTSLNKKAFQNCSSLESISIPVGVKYIYEQLFQNCTSLKTVTLSGEVKEIKASAFSGCTSLESINLPTTLNTIGNGSFYNCKALKYINYAGTIEQWNAISKQTYDKETSSEKNWDTYAGKNYSKGYNVLCSDGNPKLVNEMNTINNWNSLLQNQEATDGKYTLASKVRSLFLNNGSQIADFVPTASGYHYYWNSNDNKIYLIDNDTNESVYPNTLLSNAFVDFSTNYLTFTALEANSTIALNPRSGTFYYSLDNGKTWSSKLSTNNNETIVLKNIGDSVCLKGSSCTTNMTGKGTEDSPYVRSYFTMTGKIAASGSVTSLTDGKGINPNVVSVYSYMFCDCTSLVSAPELTSTVLKDYCYKFMFSGTSITKAPDLPATALYASCYNSMFYECESLITAPALPATTLADNCYYQMFYECSSLSKVSDLPAKVLKVNCYNKMFYGCTSLIKAPEISATTVAENCCRQMFRLCSSLTQGPSVLPAMTLAENCYLLMFGNCTKLTQTPDLPATTLATSCYEQMFLNCDSLIKASELPAETLKARCYYQMFYNCTSLTQIPSTLGKTLADNCCYSMFFNCTSLEYAPALPATTMATNCYFSMFQQCSSLKKAPDLPATTLATACYKQMFYSCKSLKEATILPASTLAQECYKSMFSATGLKITTTSTSSTKEIFTCPSSIPTGAVSYMFNNCVCGADFYTPKAGTTYYWVSQ